MPSVRRAGTDAGSSPRPREGTLESLTTRIEALEAGQALILDRMAELDERLRQATQVEQIIKRAHARELWLAMA